MYTESPAYKRLTQIVGFNGSGKVQVIEEGSEDRTEYITITGPIVIVVYGEDDLLTYDLQENYDLERFNFRYDGGFIAIKKV